MTSHPKKLIEVALPLEAINKAAAREKSIRHGHPSTLHLWWARRPLAAARAVIFAQMVDDPSSVPEEFPTLEAQEKERQRLFRLIEELVKWENTTNEPLLEKARAEIRRSWARYAGSAGILPSTDKAGGTPALPATLPAALPPLPGFHDPFAGGGALPLEAQRLGLESYASDLNPVAVLINKAMIEIPPKFAGQPPVNPEARRDKQLIARQWRGAQGLAEDVRYYGQWMRDEAEKRIGHLYPKIEITEEMVAGSAGVSPARPDLIPLLGQKLTVIAWLWARTVKSPNPAFAEVEVPLASTFMLSTKSGKEAYVEPVIENGGYRFTVKVGKPKDAQAAKNGTKLARGANFRCLMSGAVINDPYIKAESMAGRMGARLMAIVAEGERGRVYLAPTPEHEVAARQAKPEWKPDAVMNRDTANLVSGRGYGFFTWADLFTPRQLVALTTFSDLVGEARERVERDCREFGWERRRPACSEKHEGSRQDACAPSAAPGEDDRPLRDGGTGPKAYAEAVGVYLGFVVSRLADFNSTVCGWIPIVQATRNTFARQAIPMTWDYAELNVFGNWLMSYGAALEKIIKPQEIAFPAVHTGVAQALQADGQAQSLSAGKIVSTDPPYYDNIGYADLSDFFYVWLRRSLKPVFPDLFATLAVPKAEELVATPYRHGSREKAEAFFLGGMTQAMHRLAEQAHPAFPVTIYYAFKQSETETAEGTASTGWETFLDALIRAGFAITGTWPVRTELGNRMIGSGTNALASSIVLVCRPRPSDAPITTKKDFLTALRRELPAALRHLQQGNIAPVDLAQASIGPGMAVFSRYSKILETDGSPMRVRAALQEINRTLDETLAEQEGDFDRETGWAVAWFDQFGFHDGPYGDAETLSKAKNTAINALAEAGIIQTGAGKTRLLRTDEIAGSAAFQAALNDGSRRDACAPSLTVWAITHHLIRVMNEGGETAAAALVEKLGAAADSARELAYRLYSISERKKRAENALAYNALVQSWPEIIRLSREKTAAASVQEELL